MDFGLGLPADVRLTLILVFGLLLVANMVLGRANVANIRRGLFTPRKNEDRLQFGRYASRSSILANPTELAFYQSLQKIVGTRFTIFCQINLGTLFFVTGKRDRESQALRNRIDRKTVDFLLCQPTTLKPLLAIELDGPSHSRPDRKARDEFVDRLFAQAGLPLVHIPVEKMHATDWVVEQIKRNYQASHLQND